MVWLVATAVAGSGVAVVVSDDLAAYEAPVSAFVDAWGPGATVWRVHGREAEAEAIVAHLEADPPRAVFAVGAKAAWSVHQGLPAVPLVYACVRDPARYGITGPGVTGVDLSVPPETFLSQFASFFPDLHDVAVLTRPGGEHSDLARAAQEVGLNLTMLEADRPGELRTALAHAASLDALWLVPDGPTLLGPTSWRTILDDTRRRGAPLLVDTDTLVRAGGAFAVVPDPTSVGQLGAALVQRIVNGESPSSIPAISAEGRLVAVNLRALDAAGVSFDPLLRDFVDVLVQ